MALLLYVPQETQCTNVMLPLTDESAFPVEAGLLTADALATPADFAGDLDDFLGGIGTSSLTSACLASSFHLSIEDLYHG